MNTFCPVCDNFASPLLVKLKVQYYQCSSCLTVFSDALDNDNLIGGCAEVERNTLQNHERIDRITTSLQGHKDGPKILDFGCGHGMLVNDLKKAGFKHVDGFDAYNPEFRKLPKKETYHMVTMVECIEHTSKPYVEVDAILKYLLPGGILMIETSFVNIAWMENIPLEEFFYISPEAGHSTIFSHHGLDVLMVRRGYKIDRHWNRHVRAYTKPNIEQ